MPNPVRSSALVAVVLLAACSRWNPPDYTVIASPEFAGKVETYGGRDLRRDTGKGLGMVYATTTGTDCNDALTKGLHSMLEQAKAMGGDRLIHVQSKKAYNWSGELLCKGRGIRLRGIAMPAKDPSTGP